MIANVGFSPLKAAVASFPSISISSSSSSSQWRPRPVVNSRGKNPTLFYHSQTTSSSQAVPSIRASCSSSSSHLPPPPDENSPVAVWWDLGSCPVPEGFDPVRVPAAIKAAVRANAIKGPVHITVVADVFQAEHSSFPWETLSEAGVTISYSHIMGREGFTPYESMMAHLTVWLERNPPPANLFLITADLMMVGMQIHSLREDGYNVLFASIEGLAFEWPGYASIVWRWNDLLKGENLTGMHFNEMPDPPLFHPDDSEHNSLVAKQHLELLSLVRDPDWLDWLGPQSQRVAVWWDFDSIPVSNRVNLSRIWKSIFWAVKSSGMDGHPEMHCFGDAFQLSRSACEDLVSQSVFIAINHVPKGGKQSAHECLLADLKLWTSMNPPPAHLLLITSDPSFASTLRELRASDYNTLVAGDEVPDVLRKEASIVWSLNDLLKEGENAVLTYPNQGPYPSLWPFGCLPIIGRARPWLMPKSAEPVSLTESA